jgi:hypothetical protein
MRRLVTAGEHVNDIRTIARQLLGKRVPTATVEVLLFSMWFVTSRVSRVPEWKLSAVQLSEVTEVAGW